MFYQNHSFTFYTDILQFNFKKNHCTWTWKILNCLFGLNEVGLTLWHNQFELEKQLYSLTGLGLILWYTGISFEKYSDYVSDFGLILYGGVGLEKHLD